MALLRVWTGRVKQVTNTNASHKFQPGNKFGGRKPISEEVKELARAATPRAIQRQIELMESKDENVEQMGSTEFVSAEELKS